MRLQLTTLICLVALGLSACASPTASPSPAAPTAVASTGAAPAVSPTPLEPTLAPTPTAAPPAIVYLGAGGAAAAVQRAAGEFGWQVAAREPSPESIRAAAGEAAIIVVEGAEWGQATLGAARDFPDVYFIGVDQAAPGDLPANLLMLGGPESRQDQAGFLAGVAAGFATETDRVAVVGDPGSPEGRKYRNGFQNGVRLSCPKCRVDFVDVPAAGVETAKTEAGKIVLFGADVIFAAPGPAGEAALREAAASGAWVIGSGSDVYATLFENGAGPGAERVLTSVYVAVDAVVHAALSAHPSGAWLSGARPYSLAEGTIVVAPYRGTALGALDQRDIADVMARLSERSLETGVDPRTGEER